MAKTNYTRQIVDDYCVLDTETTGLQPRTHEIIEIGILKIRNNQIVDRYSQLIKPESEITPDITEHTKITNEMVQDEPFIRSVMQDVLDFIGKDIIVGHNTSFDLNFLNASFDSKLENKYVDTLQFARKLFPELKSHTLKNLVAHLNLSENTHRAIPDCIATKELYDAIKRTMRERNLEVKDLWKRPKTRKSGTKKFEDIKPTVPEDEIDKDNLFYGKNVAFTGNFEKIYQYDGAQFVVNLGGKAHDNVIKDTDYLIVGTLRGDATTSKKITEATKKNVEMIDESSFYYLIERYS